MGRRKKRRMVQQEPGATFYKPQGIPLMQLRDSTLNCEGLEAIRLADAEGLSQEEGAIIMGVSRATFGRVLAEARRTVAAALANGWAIRIEGGHYELAGDATSNQGENDMPGMKGKGSGQGMGRCMGGQGRGMGGQGRCGTGQGAGRGQGMGQGRGQGKQNRFQGGQATLQEDITMSRIAVTSEGPTMDDRVDPRFGRAGGFAIVDPETMEVVEYVDNGSSQAMAQGAGIQAAENVANAGASVLLTGYVGPKAFAALEAASIRIGQDVDGMTVREAVEKFKRGEVTMADTPNGGGQR